MNITKQETTPFLTNTAAMRSAAPHCQLRCRARRALLLRRGLVRRRLRHGGLGLQLPPLRRVRLRQPAQGGTVQKGDLSAELANGPNRSTKIHIFTVLRTSHIL